MKKLLRIFVFVLFVLPSLAHASHFMGGEITWQCLPNGNYRFLMRVYRECAGITYGNIEQLTIINYPGLSSITMNLYPDAVNGRKDLSPVCINNASYPHITCLTTGGVSNTGAVEEWSFTSDAAYPNGVTLTGTPPASGWILGFTTCCRNPCSNVTACNNLDFFLRAVIYPYGNTSEFPCWDNSPVFAERPTCILNTGFPQSYNPNAYDPEGDSLNFGWAPMLLTSISTPITTYNPGYSYNSPLPGPAQDPNNVPATIDPFTGQISFTSFTQGAFETCSRASAYKNGVKVSEIFRDMQITLLSGTNNPPVVNAPFPANALDPWTDTVIAGNLVTFTISAVDTGLQNDGITPQNVSFTASGALFGANFINDSVGCLEPPCATLSVAPPASAPSFLSTDFSWQTSCAHESFGTGNWDQWVDYYFVFCFKDDYCPLPGSSTRTVKIVVEDPMVKAPVMNNLTVDINGDVTLDWTPPDDPYGSFNKYLLYYSNELNGPFHLLDSIPEINQLSYVHTGANGNTQPLWYYMRTKCGCMANRYSRNSNLLLNHIAQTLAVNDPEEASRCILVIPDPLTGDLAIGFNNTGAKKLNLMVTDALGNQVYSTSTDISRGKNTLKFRLNQPKPGVYLYRACLDNSCQNGKFVITR